MVKYYVFIRNPFNFGLDDVVYSLKVGSSQRDQVKLALLNEYCKDCGLFLEKRSDRTDSAIDFLANGLFPGSRFARFYLRRRTISVSEAYQRVIDDSFDELENDRSEPKSFFHVMSVLNFSKNVRQLHFEGENRLPTDLRKYLSDGHVYTPTDAIISYAIVTAIFLLVAWMDGKEGVIW